MEKSELDMSGLTLDGQQRGLADDQMLRRPQLTCLNYIVIMAGRYDSTYHLDDIKLFTKQL